MKMILLNRNISFRRVHLISYCDSLIGSVFPETTPPLRYYYFSKKNLIFIYFKRLSVTQLYASSRKESTKASDVYICK